MKLPVYFSFLCFLLLFAHRIKAEWEGSDDDVPNELTNDEDDYDFEVDSPAASATATVGNKTFDCDKSEFKCLTSLECIDRFKVGDYICDCVDCSEEWKSGTCDFRKMNSSECGGWTNSVGFKNKWTVANGALRTATVTTGGTSFSLTSPNLRTPAYNCKMVMMLSMLPKNGDIFLYVEAKMKSDTSTTLSHIRPSELNASAPFTAVVVDIRPAAASHGIPYHGKYVLSLTSSPMPVGASIAIQSVHFENCNPKRTVLDCDFEGGNFCLWRLNASSPLQWNIARGMDVLAPTSGQLYLPTADHTTGTAAGHYAWTAAGNVTGNQSPIAIMTSPVLDSAVCLSLWYYMDGASFLQLSITSQGGGTRNRDILTGPSGGVWKFKQADVLAFKFGFHFTLSIEAEVEDPGGIIAIDDVKMKYGRCRFPLCNFEEGACGYSISNSSSSNSTWVLTTAQRMQDLTSMTFADHSTGTLNGHMMLFIPHSEGDISMLTSADSEWSGYRCLVFWYYISDDNVGSLEVYHHSGFSAPDLDVDKRNGYVFRGQSTLLLGGSWRRVQLTLPPLDESVVNFIATGGSDVDYGFISLDDISISNDRCRPAVSCDMEFDNCGWYLDGDLSMAPFERQQAASDRRRVHYCNGPPTDHTFLSRNGHFMNFCFHSKQQMVASIKSEDFDGHQNWCFSFWTYFTNVSNNSVRVDVYLYNMDGNNQLTSIKAGGNGNGSSSSSGWQHHQMNIAGDANYEIYYLGITVTPFGFVPNQGVAIDDISLQPYKCGYHPKPVDPNHPGDPKLPPETELFDYECSFEVNTCNYYVNRSHGAAFTIGHPSPSNLLGPLTDHSTHSWDGGFLELATPLAQPPHYALAQATKTISPDMFPNATIAAVCVDFWYVLNGQTVNWLNVSAMSSTNDTLQTAVHLEGTFGPTWRHKTTTIEFFDDFYLYFTAGTNDPVAGYVALDDIGVNVGRCPYEGFCDFQTDGCGWDNNVSLPLRFHITSAFDLNFARQSVNASLPIVDHSTATIYGNYMYLNASGFDSTGLSAALISPVTRPDKKCLQFWYYFFGDNVGSLNVYVLYNGLDNLRYLLKSEVNSDLNGWMFNQIPLERHYFDMDFQFVIEVKRGSGWGDTYRVAIDDVEIKEFCQPIGSCDFETGFCDYANLGDLVYRMHNLNMSMWARGHERALERDGKAALPGDHTIGKYGVFAYIDKGPSASLYTPYFTISKPMCLTFYYYLGGKDSNSMPYMTVELAHLNVGADPTHPTTMNATPIAQIDGKSWTADRRDRSWAKHQLTVTKTGSKMMLQFTGFIATNSAQQKGQFIAIDDISFVEGSCGKPPKHSQFPCVANPKSKADYVPMTKRCDFVKDCPSGLDEANCGYDCTFSPSVSCDWVVRNVTSTFLKVDLAHPERSPFKRVVPIRDHRVSNDYQGTYLRLWDAPGPFVDNPEANYESPWLQNADSLCSFRFYLFITDPKDRQALVRVNILRPDNPLGVEIYREEATQADQMRYWSSPVLNVGRIRGRFKLQINARLKIRQGGGAVAIDELHFFQQMCMPAVVASPDRFSCEVASNKYACDSGRKFCFGEDKLCDYNDDCGGDESAKYCDANTRAPLRCDFESGTCNWLIRPHLNTQKNKSSPTLGALNGLRWGAVDDLDDYAYGIKRDHTLNNEFGHVLYLWNQQKAVGRVESPLMVADHTQGFCTLRLYFTYQSKALVMGANTGSQIGTLNVYLKFSEQGTLFRYAQVADVRSHTFERLEVPLIDTPATPFYVVVEVVPGKDTYGIWGLDDFSFTSACTPADPKTAVTIPNYTPFPVTTQKPGYCPGDQFNCDTALCIPRNEVCDFYRDCDDGADESQCGENSFLNGWRDSSEGRLSWAIGEDGVVRSELRDGVSSTAYLNSVAFGHSGGGCTFSFSYYVASAAESLELSLLEVDRRNRTLLSRLFASTRSGSMHYGHWSGARVFIGEHQMGWRLQFAGAKDAQNNVSETVKIRDPALINCALAPYNFTNCEKKGYFTCVSTKVCIPPSQLCDYQDNCGDNSDELNCDKIDSFRCSFEGGKKTSGTCDLDLSDKKWKRFAGYETRGFIGPLIDHTTDDQLGHFMMLTGAAFSQVTVDASSAFSSPLFDPDSSGNCHLRFWYMMNGVGTLSVEKKVQGTTDLKLLSSIDTSPNDTYVWKRFSMPLLNRLPYQIVFSGKINTITTKTFISIDDISFTAACKLHGAHPHHHHGNGTTPKPGKGCLLQSQFVCNDNTCIDDDEVCDFYKNCKTGEDEADCPATCDFDHNISEDSLCLWSTSTNDRIPVHIGVSSETAVTAATKALFYPKTDNTLKTAQGKFLLIYGLNKSETVDKGVDLNIYSPQYVSSAPECTFSMDYYVATDGKDGGSSTYRISMVEVADDGIPITPYHLKYIYTTDYDQINRWNTLTVGLGRQTLTFSIVLSRLHNPNMTDSLAVDNIRFQGCAYTPPHDQSKKKCPVGQFTCPEHYNCILMDEVCDGKGDCPLASDERNCSALTGATKLDFEAADGFNSSGWTLGNRGRMGNEPWTLVQGAAPQRAALGTGPPFDHTFFNSSGHYLYSRPFDFGVDAWFISPVLKATTASATCRLLFYYYIYGLNENKIEIYVRNVTANNIIDTKAFKEKSVDEWKQASLTLQSPGSEFQIIISGVSGGDFAGVAIDDIILSSGCVVDPSKPTIPPGTTAPGTTATPEPTPSPGSNCQAGQFYCAKDNLCLPNIAKCNFVFDCSDGSDEAPPDCTQPQCPFTTGNINDQCGLDIFYAEGALNYSWIWSSAANFSHNSGVRLPAGLPSTFLYMDLNTGHRDDYSNVVSKTISESSAGCLLRFTYACTPNHCPLQVSLIAHHNSGNVKSLLWVPLDEEFTNNQPDSYGLHTADIYLGRRNTYQISIGSLKQSAAKAYVMIANIQFLNCSSAKFNANPSSVTCSADQFQCAKSYGNCIPKADVCDAQDDCRLNEDEAHCEKKKYIGICDMENFVKCDFWQFQQYDLGWSFISENGQHGLAFLPSIDHTRHSPENYYLSFHSNQLVNYLGKGAKNQLYEVYFVSNGLIADSGANCRFRFWYNLIGPQNCKLQVLKRYNTSEEHQVGPTIVSRIADYWQKADIMLSPASGTADVFQIIIRGEIKLTNGPSTEPCSVNVDDVSFTPDCVPLPDPDIPPDVPNPNTTWNLCRPNFQCANHQCYSFKQRCNFIADCDQGDGDNTDEASCPASCTFDNGNATSLCGWYTPIGSKAHFTKIKGPSPSLKVIGGTGPTGDHTSGKGSYIVATDFGDYGAKITFHSPIFASSGPSCRFSFAYFLNEPTHVEKINLFLKSGSHPPKVSKIWSYNYKHAYTQMWNAETANVGLHKDRFSLYFELIQEVRHSKADFALDDFQFTNCIQNASQLELICAENEYRCDDKTECIDYWRLCDGEIDCDDGSDESSHCTQTNGTCWFADENWLTECNWVDLKKDFNFEYEGVALNASKVRPETNTGPQELLNDQYGYALMRAKGHKFGETAAIASPVFPASSGVCAMNFHYYMYGADTMGELLVYSLGVKTGKRVDYFHLAGNQGPTWNYVDDIVVGGPAGEAYRVVFEGIVGSNHYSDIAIGYVSFSRDCAAGKWVEKSNMNLTDTCHGFYCHISHECISKDWVCDRSVDCRDGEDEMNCKKYHDRPGGPSHRGLIIAIVVVALVLVVVVPGAVFGYRRYRAAAGTSDRVPFFDNSFETTSHRDLDFTTSTSAVRGRGSASTLAASRSRKEVTFEMTTKKSNYKDD